MNLERLEIPLALNKKQFNKDLKEASSQVDSFGEGISKKLKGVGDSLSKVGKKLTTGLTLPIVAAGGLAVNAASNLQQSMGGVESVFKDASETIFEFGEISAESVGLSQREFNELALVSGALLQNLGFNANAAGDEVIDLTTRAADLAATFGGTTAEAMEAVNAAMKGSFDPLEKYGVKINAASVEAKALEMGLGDAEGKIDDNAKAAATLALFYEQTADSAGQFASESDTLAGQTQINKARLEDLGAEIGEILLPIVTDIVTKVGEFITKLQELDPSILNTILVVAGIVAAVGPVISIIGTLSTVIGAIIPILGTVATFIWSTMIPALIALGWPILLIIGIIAALVVVWLLWGDEIKAWAKRTWDAIKDWFGKVKDAVTQWVDNVKEKIAGVIEKITGVIDKIKEKIQGFIDKIKEIAGAMPDWLIPGSPTPFEIGLRGVREEFIKLEATAALPDVRGSQAPVPQIRGEQINYEKLGRVLAHELQLVLD